MRRLRQGLYTKYPVAENLRRGVFPHLSAASLRHRQRQAASGTGCTIRPHDIGRVRRLHEQAPSTTGTDRTQQQDASDTARPLCIPIAGCASYSVLCGCQAFRLRFPVLAGSVNGAANCLGGTLPCSWLAVFQAVRHPSGTNIARLQQHQKCRAADTLGG